MRAAYVARPLLLGPVVKPCGHRVRGEMVRRGDGRVVVTMYPPWGQVPHMHTGTDDRDPQTPPPPPAG